MFKPFKITEAPQGAFDRMHGLLEEGGEATRAIGDFFHNHAVIIDKFAPVMGGEAKASDVEIESMSTSPLSVAFERANQDKRTQEKPAGFTGLTKHSERMIAAADGLAKLHGIFEETFGKVRESVPTIATFDAKRQEGLSPMDAMNAAYKE